MMTDDDLIGKQFNEYVLEALLGEGGMARVYRGRDVLLQRYAAIKVITPAYRQEKDYLERFAREARAIARLEHPHVVRLYRYGEADGLLFMAMQYIEGMDLGSVLLSYRQSGEYLEFPEAIRLIREIGSALDYIHAQGIIHRDVKSSNIMLDKAGRAHLTDFGLALMTEVGTRGEIFGSPHYLAPEQAISSAKAVPQSDLYSLGVIAYEMFSGMLPFDADDPLDIAMLHMSQEPPSPRSHRSELPEALEAVLLKALAKDPEERYPSGAGLSEAVEAALAVPILQHKLPPPTSKTIPERVALNLVNRPLPPIPAVAVPPPPALEIRPQAAALESDPFTGVPDVPAAHEISPPEPLPDGQAALPTPQVNGQSLPGILPKKHADPLPVVVSVGAVLSLCLVVGCLLVYVLNQAWLPGPGGTSQGPFRTQSVVGDKGTDATPTSVGSGLSSPTSTKVGRQTAAPTHTPTPIGPVVVALKIVRCDEGHCLGMINDSRSALPLARFALYGKDLYIAGNSWGITELPPGGCLVLTGNAGKWTPEQRECQPAASTLVSETDFWKIDLEVEYAGETYGKCRKDRDDCEFTIRIR